MKRCVRTVVAMLAGAAGASALASEPPQDFDAGDAQSVRPWRRQPASHVDIVATGLGDARRDAVSEPADCSTFRPSARQVRRFVNVGKRVSARGYLHDADWSACRATGTLRWKDGSDGEWTVQRFGAGFVTMNGERHYLVCDDCRLEPQARGAR